MLNAKSQKGIIIGHKGEAIKKVGIEARKRPGDVFSGKQIFFRDFCEGGTGLEEEGRKTQTIRIFELTN